MDLRLGIIGTGNMGGALIHGLIRFNAIAASRLFAVGHHPEKLEALRAETGITVCESISELIEKCDAVLFAVKPKHIEAILAEHKSALKDKALLSVVNGYSFDKFEGLLGEGYRHLYIMPNTPVSVGSGVLLFEKKHSLSDSEYMWAKSTFEKIGAVIELDASLMAAGGAVAGCGPAFVSIMLEALADAAVKHGIPRETAYALASNTALGTAKMQIATGMHPAVIKDGVCSPAGTTIRGVQALEKAGMRSAFMDAIDAVMAFSH